MSDQRNRRVRGTFRDGSINPNLTEEERLGVLADQYMNLRENEKLLGNAKGKLKDEISTIVEEIGEKEDTQNSEPNFSIVVKRGTRKIKVTSAYIASRVPVSDIVEVIKANVINKALLSKLIKVEETVDMDALNKAVADEKLDPDFVESLFEEAKGYRRLDVRKVK